MSMAISKFSVNLIFAAIVIALALTAAMFIQTNSTRNDTQPAAVQETPGGSMPPIDAQQRLAAMEQLSAQDPQNADYQTQTANLYYDIGQYEKAVSFYEKSLSLRPNDPNVETDLAVSFHYIGQSDKALERLDNVLRYSPGFPQAMFNKGVILMEARKDAKGAIAIWEDLLRLNPSYAQRSDLERRIRQLKGSNQ